MTLQELFRLWLGEGGRFYKNQEGLAEFLGLQQSQVSAIKNGQVQWEKHWAVITQKIIPECVKLGINVGCPPPRVSKPRARHIEEER